MVALALAMALLGLFFLSLILFLVLGTMDIGHGPVKTLFLGLILCLVPMTVCVVIRVIFFSAVNARNQKTVTSCNFFFLL